MPLPGGLSMLSTPLLLTAATTAPGLLAAVAGEGEGGDADGDGFLEGLALVRWSLSLAEGTGQWVLLCRAFEAVTALQQVGRAMCLVVW